MIYEKLQNISDAQNDRLCRTFKKEAPKRKRDVCGDDAGDFDWAQNRVVIDLFTPLPGFDVTEMEGMYKNFIVSELQLFHREVLLGQRDLFFNHYWLYYDFRTPPFVQGGRGRTKVTLKTILEQRETIASFFFNFLFYSFYDKVENLIQQIVDEKVDDVAITRGNELKQMQSREMALIQNYFSGEDMLDVVKLADDLFSLAFLVAIDKQATQYDREIEEGDTGEETTEDIRTVSTIILDAVDDATEKQRNKPILYNADNLGLGPKINQQFVALVNGIVATEDMEDILADSDSDEDDDMEVEEMTIAVESDSDYNPDSN